MESDAFIRREQVQSKTGKQALESRQEKYAQDTWTDVPMANAGQEQAVVARPGAGRGG